MAGIDKTYVTKEEYLLAREFWLKTRKQQTKELGYPIYLYPLQGEYKDYQIKLGIHNILKKDIANMYAITKEDVENPSGDFVLWNTTERQDLWLAKNCDLDFVQERLKYQYNEDWYGFKLRDKIDFTKEANVYEITELSSESTIYLYRSYDKENQIIEFLPKLLVYGTGKLMDLYAEGLENISSNFNITKGIETKYTYLGLYLKNLDNKTYLCDDKFETIEEIEDLCGTGLYNFKNLPKIKHSYNGNDADFYDDSEIFVSNNKECFALDSYEDFHRSRINRHILIDIPKHLQKVIKTRDTSRNRFYYKLLFKANDTYHKILNNINA